MFRGMWPVRKKPYRDPCSGSVISAIRLLSPKEQYDVSDPEQVAAQEQFFQWPLWLKIGKV